MLSNMLRSKIKSKTSDGKGNYWITLLYSQHLSCNIFVLFTKVNARHVFIQKDESQTSLDPVDPASRQVWKKCLNGAVSAFCTIRSTGVQAGYFLFLMNSCAFTRD